MVTSIKVLCGPGDSTESNEGGKTGNLSKSKSIISKQKRSGQQGKVISSPSDCTEAKT